MTDQRVDPDVIQEIRERAMRPESEVESLDDIAILLDEVDALTEGWAAAFLKIMFLNQELAALRFRAETAERERDDERFNAKELHCALDMAMASYGEMVHDEKARLAALREALEKAQALIHYEHCDGVHETLHDEDCYHSEYCREIEALLASPGEAPTSQPPASTEPRDGE